MTTSLKYSISEVKRVLKLEKEFITLVVFQFPEYFSLHSNVSKGESRFFTLDDISTIGYISSLWEDNPDYENIKIGLNRSEHLEYPFNQHYFDLVPIIRDDFENIESNSANFIFFNRAIFSTNFELAKQYLDSTRVLIKDAYTHQEPWLRLFPILFNLRHSIELFLKSFIKKDMCYTHDLEKIYIQFRQEKNTSLGIQFEKFINTLHEYDNRGTTYRYVNHKINYEELFLDLNHTLIIMERFEKLMTKMLNL